MPDDAAVSESPDEQVESLLHDQTPQELAREVVRLRGWMSLIATRALTGHWKESEFSREFVPHYEPAWKVKVGQADRALAGDPVDE